MGQLQIRASVDVRLAGDPDDVAKALEQLCDQVVEVGLVYDDELEITYGKRWAIRWINSPCPCFHVDRRTGHSITWTIQEGAIEEGRLTPIPPTTRR